MSTPSSWSEYQADLERLASLYPARDIAAILGVTRNAVIGRAHRTGVKLLDRHEALRKVLSSPVEKAKRLESKRLFWSETPLFPCGHSRSEDNRYKNGRKNCWACRACSLERTRRKRQSSMAVGEAA